MTKDFVLVVIVDYASDIRITSYLTKGQFCSRDPRLCNVRSYFLGPVLDGLQKEDVRFKVVFLLEMP